MKRMLICLALAGSAFARVRVVPPVPTNLTPVTLYFASVAGCPLDALGATVQRTGQTIRVRLGFDDGCILAVVDDWHIAVPLGALEAGHYEVFADGYAGTEAVQFEVLDATAFPITPPGIHVNRCSEQSDLYVPEVFYEAELRIGNGNGHLHGYKILHVDDCPTPGLHDIEMTDDYGETVIARNAFTVYDGSATHPYVHEDVLVPIYFNGRSAGGDWRTELALRATDSVNREVPLYTPWGSLKAGTSRSVIAAADIGNRANGFFLRVARNGVERFRPEVRVWDAAVPGVVPTRLPIVRERDWLAGDSVIESLPVADGTHVTVRVYAPDDDLERLVIDDQIRGRVIRPTRASADAARFASYEFVVAGALGLPKMTFTPREFGSRYWVMVTLTDHAGRVVVLIPQLEESRG